MESRFPLGQLLASAAVSRAMNDEPAFADFVNRSFDRYTQADWGEMCDDDRQQNDDALTHGDNRIFAAYTNALHPGWKLWIITERDHSATTILFPSDY